MHDYVCIQRVDHHVSPEGRAALLKSLEDYPGAHKGGVIVGAYNPNFTGLPPEESYQNQKKFMRDINALGYDCQIGLGTTIGHIDAWGKEKRVPYDTMVGDDGTDTATIACPRSERFLRQMVLLSRKYAELYPKVLWIDDDFRICHHKPISFGCFCDSCVARFNREYGYSYDRETLVAALTSGEGNTRADWLSYNRAAMTNVLRVITDAVHEVSPDISMGLMQVNPDFTIYGCPRYDDFVRAMKGKNGTVWFRHGSGAYGDSDIAEIIAKNVSIGRLCAMTEGEGVVNVTEEVTCPYTKRQKSMRVTVMEAVMNLGVAGADGITDEAIKPNLLEQLGPKSIVAEMHRQYPYLSTLRGLLKGKTQVGIYPYFSPDLWVYNDRKDTLSGMNDLGSMDWLNLFYLGIPFTFREAGAKTILFSGKTVRAMPREELERWMSRGVYADGTSAMEINRVLGGTPTGVKHFPREHEALHAFGLGEKFTSHPLNKEHAGFSRADTWFMAEVGTACVESAGADVLAYSLFDDEAAEGIVGTAVYENPYGGRNAVFDRGAWGEDILSVAKSEQIKNTLDWLCGGAMPVRVDTDCKMGVSAWDSGDAAERVVVLYNTDFDDAVDAVLTLDGEYCGEFQTPDLEWTSLGRGRRFTLPKIPAWTTAVLRFTK